MDALWGESAPETASNLIQAHISRLRKQLAPSGGEVIVSAGGGYRLQVHAGCLDVLLFKELTVKAEVTRRSGSELLACDLYEQALTLWRGDPLADLDVLHNHPGIAVQRRQFVNALLKYSEIACEHGLHDRVLPRLRAVAAAENLDERIHAQLMIALAGTGQQAAAMCVYEDIRGRLDRGFGIYPGEELCNAHMRVLHQNVPVVIRSYGQASSRHVEPRQLPASAKSFTGREYEGRRLSELLLKASPEPGTVAVVTLTGMAGVGKTALAVNWAHQVANRFPDGQLFMNLGRSGDADAPMRPVEVLGSFLTSLGVPPTRATGNAADLAALYRSALASRRVLIVLDNAMDAEQVRPLLPGSSGCRVLVTSRSQLIGLASADGAHVLPVHEMTTRDSFNLLAGILGAERLMAERAGAEDLITLCGGLPLALCNVATRALVSPGRSLATLADELRQRQGRLNALETGEPTTSVRASFDSSFRRLTGQTSDMFSILGMHPGTEITAGSAAALAKLSQPKVKEALARLCDEHMLTELIPGRYEYHELLRIYATELAAVRISELGRRSAVYRLLDYYLHTTSAASALVFPSIPPRALADLLPGVIPETLSDSRDAMQWVQGERSSLLAAISLAAVGDYRPHAWELPWAAGRLLSGEECWRKLANAQETVLKNTSRDDGDPDAALAHYHLAWLKFRLGNYIAACRHLDAFLRAAPPVNSGKTYLPTASSAGTPRPEDAVAVALVRVGQAFGLCS